MDKDILKEVVIEQQRALQEIPPGITREALQEVSSHVSKSHVIVISGMRRVGKSTLLRQIMQQYYPNGVYYLSFEDERLLHFQVSDFNALYETFVECFGTKKVFFLDEIQVVPHWELFVRRMQDRGFKFFITGSNAALLSKELGTKLTGRTIIVELYPFSFREFLAYHQYTPTKTALSDTTERGKLKKHFNAYLSHGGMPEYLKYHDLSLINRTYEDILYRDIVSRYEIREIKALRELAFYLLSNLAHTVSFTKAKSMLALGSVNTVKNYTFYLENSFLIFTLNKFSFSVKQQNLSNKKIYAIDNGLVESVAYQFSKNVGSYLENLVYLELRRMKKEVYYYKTQKDLEVDFLLWEKRKVTGLIQVSEKLEDPETREREINALRDAMEETDLHHGLILTRNHSEEIKLGKYTISIQPIYQWLMSHLQ